jgi:hypothetical protein
MKILPCADHESTEDAFVAVPKKSRYMAMPLANTPQKMLCTTGRDLLCTKK